MSSPLILSFSTSYAHSEPSLASPVVHLEIEKRARATSPSDTVEYQSGARDRHRSRNTNSLISFAQGSHEEVQTTRRCPFDIHRSAGACASRPAEVRETHYVAVLEHSSLLLRHVRRLGGGGHPVLFDSYPR